MSDTLKTFVRDVELATTKRKVLAIGKVMAEHFDAERASLLSEQRERDAKTADLYRAQYLAPIADTDYAKGFIRGTETACENIAAAIRAQKREG